MQYTKEQYYQTIKDYLLGTSITQVYYEVLNSYDESDLYMDWELSNTIHSIDMNIIFKLDNGKLIQLFWDNNFDCYGIGLEVLNDFIERESVKLINVSDDGIISKIIDNKITDVLVNWDVSDVTGLEMKDNQIIGREIRQPNIPSIWQIIFENPIYMWITTFEISNHKQPYYLADHLTIFFDKTELKKYKLDYGNVISINSIK